VGRGNFLSKKRLFLTKEASNEPLLEAKIQAKARPITIVVIGTVAVLPINGRRAVIATVSPRLVIPSMTPIVAIVMTMVPVSVVAMMTAAVVMAATIIMAAAGGNF